jgi:two-component system, sensor histidine kinase and response regulator
MDERTKAMILVVDDTPENIDVLSGLLGDDYDVKVAKNGEIALKIAGKMIPDLILLDIMMPGIDGYEVCRRLKSDEETKEIPVIFITAKTEMEDEIKGFEIGGVDFITKPISPPIVTARVKAHLALQREKLLLKENLRLRGDVERITRHDLKTPLNPILSYPSLMKNDDNLTEKQIKYITTIESSGRKMLNMINMSLDLYKMEQGTYEVKPEDVDLIQIFDEIKVETKIRLKVKRLSIDTLIDGAPAGESDQYILQGEKLLLYSMLANLFKNSVEASPKNEKILISMKKGENRFVSIHNQGAVPEEIRNNFFEKYATAGKSGGTGLGTYSARLIAETLGGQISLDTSKENGTTIRIDFPQNA